MTASTNQQMIICLQKDCGQAQSPSKFWYQYFFERVTWYFKFGTQNGHGKY